MNLKRNSFLWLILSLWLLLNGLALANTTKFTILHVNDLHGFLLPFEYEGEIRGGAPQLAGVIGNIKAENPNTLLLAAGDMIAGTGGNYRREQLTSGLWGFRGILDMKVMNLMEFDAMVLGNHEFDYGKRWMTRLVTEADFPVLSANIVHHDLIAAKQRDGQLIVSPYQIFERGGLRIAVVGVTTNKDMQTRQIQVIDPSDAIRELLPEIKSKSDLIVVLSHLGLGNDRKLAQELSGEIDVIIGGHSHILTKEPYYEGDTMIVHVGKWGVNLGVLDLLVDNKENVIKSEFKVIPIVEKTPADYKLSKFIEESLIFGEVVGGELWSSYEEQSPFGKLMTDAMCWLTEADFAFVGSGLSEGTLPTGPISAIDFFEALWPYRSRAGGPQKDLDEEQIVALVQDSPDLALRTLIFNSDMLETIVLLELSGKEIYDFLIANDTRKGTQFFLQHSSELNDTAIRTALENDHQTYRVAVNLNVAMNNNEYGLSEKYGTLEITNTEVFEAVLLYLESIKTFHVHFEGI